MKKTLLLLAAFIVSAAASAQFSFGVKAGYNTSLGFDNNWNFNSSSINLQNDMANGFHVGLYARIGRSLYVQPELLYNLDIYRQKLSAGEWNTDGPYTEIKASTFDVPVLLGYSIINTNMFKLRVMVGPKFRFNCGSTKVAEQDGVKASAKPVQVGLDTGLGIDVWRLTLDVRYNLIGDLYKYEANGEKLNTSPNNAFTVSLGFRLLGNNRRR